MKCFLLIQKVEIFKMVSKMAAILKQNLVSNQNRKDNNYFLIVFNRCTL